MFTTLRYAWGMGQLIRHQRRRQKDPALRPELNGLEAQAAVQLWNQIGHLRVLAHSLKMWEVHPGETLRDDLDAVCREAAEYLEAAARSMEEIYDDLIAFNARKREAQS